MVKRYDVGTRNSTVTIDLDKMISKYDKFIKGSKLLNDVLLVAISESLDALATMGKEYAQSRLIAYDLGDSELYSNLSVERHSEGIYITTNASNDWGFDYAMYVEFGTGIVGSNSPHPKAGFEDWKYDVNSHGTSGWWYPSKESDPNPTKYLDSKGEWWAWTSGQISKPFMYDTWLYLSWSWHSVMSGYINRALKEWGDELL